MVNEFFYYENFSYQNIEQLQISMVMLNLKDKSGVDKIIVESNLTDCRTPVVSSFQVLMPQTFINCLMNLRKLG